jgi:imidazolonepropionase-like amidohydrolase
MTPADAIKAATVTAAELLDLSDTVGTLAPGKSADVIAVAGDPLSDVTELERVKFVMAAGQLARVEA